MKVVDLEVYPVGSRVRILDPDLKGNIVSVGIVSRAEVQYKVSYWNGKDREEEWMDPWEIELEKNEQPTRIGFVR